MLAGRMGISIDIKSYLHLRHVQYLFQDCVCFFNTVIEGPPDFRVGKVGRRWENLLCPVKQKPSKVNVVLCRIVQEILLCPTHSPQKKKRVCISITRSPSGGRMFHSKSYQYTAERNLHFLTFFMPGNVLSKVLLEVKPSF